MFALQTSRARPLAQPPPPPPSPLLLLPSPLPLQQHQKVKLDYLSILSWFTCDGQQTRIDILSRTSANQQLIAAIRGNQTPLLLGSITDASQPVFRHNALMDKEVLRDIWQGQLPLCFRLYSDDVCGMHRPEPYYMMVPRITYFPLVLDRVVKYFNRFMDQSKQTTDNMWLDYNGQAIKWHHPVGLSWDLFGSSYDLPWKLILHFSDFPAKELVRCNTKASIKTNFLSTIKEADSLKHKGSVTKNMLEKDQNQLWLSLVNYRYEQFWSINKRLMDKIDNELFRYIPFRLYFPDYTYVQKVIKPCTIGPPPFEGIERSQTSTSAQLDKDIVISKLHKCGHSQAEILESEASEHSRHRYSTMMDLIQISFINRIDDLIESRGGGDSDEVEGGDSQAQQHDDILEKKPIDVRSFKYRFLSHGIEIPFDTPLQWLSEHLSYADNFLHICAVSKRTT